MKRLQVLEAGLFLLLARLALKILPFRAIAWYLRRPMDDHQSDREVRRQLHKQVKQSIERACLIVSCVCFPRALAAHAMLRRRGVSTTLHYGAATLPGLGLIAHVWLQDGEDDVIGYRARHRYHRLSSFGPGSDPT